MKTQRVKNKRTEKKDYKKFVPFLIKFSIISATGTIILPLLNLSLFTNSIVDIVAAISNVTAFGDILYVKNQPLVVTNMCIGLESTIILAAVIFSLKKPEFNKKVYNLAIAGMFLLAINLVRIITVVEIAKIDFSLVDFVHMVSWLFTTAVIFAAWYVLSKKELEKHTLEELI